MFLQRLVLVLLLLAPMGWSQGVIRLKTRNLTPAGGSMAARTDVVRHYLVLFQSYPGPEVLAELASRRIRVLSYVPDNALMVSTRDLNLQGLGAIWSGPMAAADKLSPAAELLSAGAYLVVFQPDTSMALNRALMRESGYTVVENRGLLNAQLAVSGAYSGLSTLASFDEVAYILPAAPELLGGNPPMRCAGALTQAGPVAEYVQASSGWTKDASGVAALQYFFDSVTPRVQDSLVRSEIARAFAEWARYANLTITPANQPNLAHSIDILFARFSHGDAYPFDGPGGQLAHTFYPSPANNEPIAGDMHLDADESWGVGSGVDLYSVALHETGHALGLGHSDKPGSVMYPYYRVQTALTPDDIAGIQAIYGANPQSVPTTTGSGTTATTSGGTKPTTSSGGTTTSTPTDTVPPTLSIGSPSSTIVSAYSATLTVSGKAADNVGVTAVKWTTSTGGAGNATGTTSWSAVIPLLKGDNTVTVRADDAAGNSSWRAITVVRN